MSINISDDNKVPPEIYYEEQASQEELYLEETEEELGAVLTSNDPSPHNATAEGWERKREALELSWTTQIDDRRK
jgi:hypothetical protein